MTPDSDSYTHILLNGVLWYLVLFGVPAAVYGAQKVKRRLDRWADQRVREAVNAALHPSTPLRRTR